MKHIDVKKIMVDDFDSEKEIDFNRWLVESLTPRQLAGLDLQVPASWRWSYFINNGVAVIGENVTPTDEGWEYYDDWLHSR